MSQVARSPQGEIEVWIQDQECWNGSDPSQPKRIGGVELREEMTAPWIEERRIADGELQSGDELGPRVLQGRIRPPPPLLLLFLSSSSSSALPPLGGDPYSGDPPEPGGVPDPVCPPAGGT
ncbi:hypothetical protein PR002_g31840 [Phytophthora rubi]|uniref:Uncharacterized protein n=1 Tax=Phytophthora rubi TaxID=129364 RepID=A0A6A3G9H2_9STRA|nr:hypothetical protein PR002_g31840 [Phytophthora rubi]